MYHNSNNIFTIYILQVSWCNSHIIFHIKFFIWYFRLLHHAVLQYSIYWIVRYNLCSACCFYTCRSVGWRPQRQWLPLDSFLPSVDNYYCSQSGGGTLCHWAQNRDPSALWRWATFPWVHSALEFVWHCLLMMYLCILSKPVKWGASADNVGALLLMMIQN